MINDAMNFPDVPVDRDAMTMPFVLVSRQFWPIENGSRWVERPTQRPPINAIDESCLIASHAIVSHRSCDLSNKLIAQLIVGVERQNPWSLYLFETEIALGCKI